MVHQTNTLVKEFVQSSIKTYAQALYGKDDIEFECLNLLWTIESHWNYKAIGVKTTQGKAYGIAQALPADKMAVVGNNYKTNPYTQIKWGLKYIKSRYNNDACSALRHEFRYGWY